MSLFDIPAIIERLHIDVGNEWYTPLRYIEAAKKVMGGAIDLDPASCDVANQTVKAIHYYSKENDGLSHPWHIDGKPARVWLNPPYGNTDGKSNSEIWSQRLLREYIAGNVSEAILLVQAKPGYIWFDALWDYPTCFTKTRIRFITPKGAGGLAVMGSAFTYFGANEQKFIDVFRRFGRVAKAIDTSHEPPRNLELWTA